MSEKRVITAFGIYHYGWMLRSLEQKLKKVVSAIFYTELDINEEVSELSKLKEVIFFEEIGDWAERWKNWISENGLPYYSAKEFHENVIRWQEKFESVLRKEKIGIVFLETEFLDAEKLRRNLEKLLSKEETEWLTDFEEVCLEDARVCILLRRPTPAEFMCVRCAESILRRWYKWKTVKDIGKKGWGQILEELADEYGKDYPEQLELLRYLKGTRNRLAHPEKISTQADAEHTFSMIIKFVKETYMVMK